MEATIIRDQEATIDLFTFVTPAGNEPLAVDMNTVGVGEGQVWINCLYHLPRSWLKPPNLIVVFEEWGGGDPNRISLVKRTRKNIIHSYPEGVDANQTSLTNRLSIFLLPTY
ncbi:hypothetical protein YC2023_118424 [Brassica napus]